MVSAVSKKRRSHFNKTQDDTNAYDDDDGDDFLRNWDFQRAKFSYV